LALASPWAHRCLKVVYNHNFLAPHIDAVESVIDYGLPVNKVPPFAEFDGSVVVDRTPGDVSAGGHDEQAHFLALELMRRQRSQLSGTRRTWHTRGYPACSFTHAT
jgi:hypothetical protein